VLMLLREPALQVLGSAGCQPVLFGSLPKSLHLSDWLIFRLRHRGLSSASCRRQQASSPRYPESQSVTAR
jgi:hypothetical protein